MLAASQSAWREFRTWTACPRCRSTLAQVVAELATNAIKHAFREEGPGLIRLSATNGDSGATSVFEDHGAPLPEQTDPRPHGRFGMEQVGRLTASAGGLFIASVAGTTAFEPRVRRKAIGR